MLNKMKNHIVGLSLILSLSLIPTNISANAQSNNESSNNDNGQDISLTLENVRDKKTVVKEFEKNGEKYTLTVEDITPPSIQPFGSTDSTQLNAGPYSKRITMHSQTTSISAVFSGTVNPYISTMKKPSSGRYSSAYFQFIRDRYTLTTASAQAPYASMGSYEVDFTSPKGGTLTDYLTVMVYTTGYVHIMYLP